MPNSLGKGARPLYYKVKGRRVERMGRGSRSGERGLALVLVMTVVMALAIVATPLA